MTISMPLILYAVALLMRSLSMKTCSGVNSFTIISATRFTFAPLDSKKEAASKSCVVVEDIENFRFLRRDQASLWLLLPEIGYTFFLKNMNDYGCGRAGIFNNLQIPLNVIAGGGMVIIDMNFYLIVIDKLASSPILDFCRVSTRISVSTSL